MTNVNMKKPPRGRLSITLSSNGDDVVRIPDPGIAPYRAGSAREKAWNVVKLMDGLSVREAHEILMKLEPGIQGKVGRPLGWVVDAVNYGYATIEKG